MQVPVVRKFMTDDAPIHNEEIVRMNIWLSRFKASVTVSLNVNSYWCFV